VSQDALLAIKATELKMLREVLCEAQNATPKISSKARLQILINEIDRHRPLGPDGKHGELHTSTCGCERD
jgi:hypothetical protein